MSGEYVDPGEMAHQLEWAGWKKINRHTWQSPSGDYYRGPFEAWREMKAQTK